MPDLHKTLILANVVIEESVNNKHQSASYRVDELAIATEHAPFRHKKVKGVGEQRKR